MKTIILAIPRSGSSHLLYTIAERDGLRPIFEPFDNTGRNFYDKTEDNIVVKTIVSQCKNDRELLKEFDNIILLSRRDLISGAESYSYFIKNLKKGFTSYQSYFYEGVDSVEFEHAYNILLDKHYKLKQISKELNIPITYYEDIYDLESPHKLRKFSKNELTRTIL